MDDHDEDALTRELSIRFAEQAIRNGEVDIEGKSDQEVAIELGQWLLTFPESKEPFEMQLDHSRSLVGEATRFHESGNDDFAVMLCATQIEHWLNYMITWGCTRHHGMEPDEAKRVIRQSNLHVKTGWLWRLLYQVWMRADLVARIGEVADRRNAFVHYKWESFDPDIDDMPQRTACRPGCRCVPDYRRVERTRGSPDVERPTRSDRSGHGPPADGGLLTGPQGMGHDAPVWTHEPPGYDCPFCRQRDVNDERNQGGDVIAVTELADAWISPKW